MPSTEVAVIDYGVGNLLSVQRGFEHCGANVVVTSSPDQILVASRVVLPGVGAFRTAMDALRDLHLVDVIRTVADRGVPLLGICLGMQLLLDQSEEFEVTAGLGLIAGRVVAIPTRTVSGEPQKIPHIGWSGLVPATADRDWGGTVLAGIRPGESVYFVHSFMAEPAIAKHRIADCLYGNHPVSALIGRENVMGCQFHPEKSGDVGLRIMRSFLELQAGG